MRFETKQKQPRCHETLFSSRSGGRREKAVQNGGVAAPLPRPLFCTSCPRNAKKWGRHEKAVQNRALKKCTWTKKRYKTGVVAQPLFCTSDRGAEVRKCPKTGGTKQGSWHRGRFVPPVFGLCCTSCRGAEVRNRGCATTPALYLFLPSVPFLPPESGTKQGQPSPLPGPLFCTSFCRAAVKLSGAARGLGPAAG